MNLEHTLITSLYDIGAIQFGEFTLKSGQTSTIYLNLRKIISFPTLLRHIAEAMWEKVKNERFDLVCGVPYTALPIATCLSLDHHIPMVMRRKEKKEYGTKQTIEGVYQPNQRCLIIEDVITTGSSIIETADELANHGIHINDVVVLIDREQGGKATLEKRFRVHTLLTMSAILQHLLQSSSLSSQERECIEKFLAERSIS